MSLVAEAVSLPTVIFTSSRDITEPHRRALEHLSRECRVLLIGKGRAAAAVCRVSALLVEAADRAHVASIRTALDPRTGAATLTAVVAVRSAAAQTQQKPSFPRVHVCASDWAHLASGGRHVVFSYKGSERRWVGRVLRTVLLKKAECPDSAHVDACAARSWLKDDMLPLIGTHAFTDDPEVVSLDPAVAADLTRRGRDKKGRPLVRPLLSSYAEVMPDYSAGFDLMVEVKPKMGCLWPRVELWAGGTSDRHWVGSVDHLKTKCCRYAMQQVAKLDGGHVGTLTRYDPVDLFSGDLARVEQSISSLLDVPQNNLVLMREGRPVSVGAAVKEEDRPALVTAVSQALQRSGVLPAVLRAQTATAVDACQAAAVPRATTDVWVVSEEWPVGMAGSTADIMWQGLRNVAELQPMQPRPRPTPPAAYRCHWPTVLRNFRKTRSAQDCSLVVGLTRTADGWHCPPERVRIIDLDLKKESNLQYWAEQDASLCVHFRKVCDAGTLPGSPVQGGVDIAPSDWQQLRAGSRYIVYRYTGMVQEHRGYALRLRMVSKSRTVEEAAARAAEARVWVGLMREVLGPHLVDVPRTVPCCAYTSQALREKSRDRRGLSLRVPLLFGADAAELIPDYTRGGDTVVVVKPKMGSLSPHVEVWAGGQAARCWVGVGDPIKRVCSRYGMHQCWKFASGRVDKLSAYEPGDLFSGDRERMRSAVRGLLDAPQNNILLLRRGDAVATDSMPEAERSALCAAVVDALLRSDALPRLHKAQTRSPLDPTQVARISQQTDLVWIAAAPWPAHTDSRSRVHDLLQGTPASSLKELTAAPQQPRDAPPGAVCVPWKQAFTDFQIARSAQHCSLVVTLHSCPGGYRAAGVRITDTDVMPESLRPYWAEQDQVICDSFRRSCGLDEFASGAGWGDWRCSLEAPRRRVSRARLAAPPPTLHSHDESSDSFRYYE